MPSALKSATPDDLFLSSRDGNYTYGDLHLFARYFIKILQEQNIDEHQPVGLCANSSDELIFIIAACWLQGIPFASFDPGSTAAALRNQIDRINPSLIIMDEKNPDANSVHSIDSVRSLNIESFNLKQVLAYDSASSDSSVDKSGSRNIAKDPTVKDKTEDNIFGYFFTSGTSGTPKIVPLKRRQMISGARSSAQNLHPAVNELWLLCLPLNHIGGISVILRSLLYGSGIYRMDEFDADETALLLSEEQRIVAASLVPTMLKRLVEMEASTFNPHLGLKGILLGGGPTSADLLADCIDRKIPVIPSYGMTETCAQIAANPLFSSPENSEILQSAGTVFEPNRIEIRNQKERTIDRGLSGSVWLKGPQVFDCYQGDPDSGFDADGWFDTGDFGRLDDQGRLFIEARRTDLIVTGGENVSPFEVEDTLKGIHGIRDAAVIGLPDEEWGQKVAAAVVFDEQKKRPESELKKILKERLEGFKVPKKIIVVESLPRTETGKMKRSELSSVFSSKK